MEVKVVSRKLIKPCIPTPENLKVYKLSFFDEVSSTIYVLFFYFYSLTSVSNFNLHHNYIEQLEISLSKILPHFYPFAGRYNHKDCYIDCNDQGAEFVEAACNVDLLEFIRQVKREQLSVFIQKDTSVAILEVTDPVISIQVTTFKCGGLAIGSSFTHRIVDAASMMTFMATWSNATRCESTEMTMMITPTFDTPSLFPFKDLVIGIDHDMDVPITRGPNVVAKRLLFNNEAIRSLKAKTPVRASKVCLVCAVLAKALIGVDRAKQGGKSKTCFLQAVNMRARTIPPLPKHSCGNLVMQAETEISKDNIDIIGFEDLVVRLDDAIDKTIANCTEMLGRGDPGHNIFLDPIREKIQNVRTYLNNTNVIWFTDWTKFGFYQVADFGWGEPVWGSIGIMGERVIVLLENKEGDGIEALVHLNKNDMLYFEEDEDIKLLFAAA